MSEYKTIESFKECEYTVQRSRFIGRVYHVENEAEALNIVNSVRKEYWDARHCCYAFRIGTKQIIARSNDDGEPSGTAGKPILEVIEKRNLTNVLVLSVRYFGGILLGTGGLTRAYSKSASDVIDESEITTFRLCDIIRADLQYPMWGRIEPFLRMNAKIADIAYSDVVSVLFDVPEGQSDSLRKALVEKTDGKIRLSTEGKEYIPFKNA